MVSLLTVTAASSLPCRIRTASSSSCGKGFKCLEASVASTPSLRDFWQDDDNAHYDTRTSHKRKVDRPMLIRTKAQDCQHMTKLGSRLTATISGVLALSPLFSGLDSDWAYATPVTGEAASSESLADLAGPVLELADLDAGTAQLLAAILAPIFTGLSILFVIRIVMSWYPQLPVKEFPYVIAFAPTEPVLGPTRRLLPPVGGVDVSPVVWLFIVTFANELLLGQQGLLVLLSEKI